MFVLNFLSAVILFSSLYIAWNGITVVILMHLIVGLFLFFPLLQGIMSGIESSVYLGPVVVASCRI